MNLSFFIARRYLFAKKSHNVINIISIISLVGMAVGMAALVVILSVYNGFDGLVRSMMSSVEPDLLVLPSEGKVFRTSDYADDFGRICALNGVESVCTVLEENVYLSYDSRQSVVRAKGVDDIYEAESPLREHLNSGTFRLHRGDVPLAAVGAGLAYRMGINPRFVAPLELYFPSRTRPVRLGSPAESMEEVKVYPSCVFSVNSDIDRSLIVLPIEKMRQLLEYTDEVSAVEIRTEPGADAAEVERKVAGCLEGSALEVRGRFRQNESLYKMMAYEKLSIGVILLFVMVIIAFNIFGSLSMLILEKKGDVATLRSLGADDGLVRRIFVLEGWLISLLGMLLGLAAGLGLCWLQQRFGWVKMPGNFIVDAYPVAVSWKDVLLSAAAVSLIGYLVALLPVRLQLKKG